MAHPNLSSLINRSVLTVSTAALLAGPFAGVGAAQIDAGLPDTDDTLNETVKNVTDPVEKATEDAKRTTKKTEKKVRETADKVTTQEKPSEEPSEEPKDGGPTSPLPKPDAPEPTNPPKSDAPAPTDPAPNRDQPTSREQRTSGGNVRPISEGTPASGSPHQVAMEDKPYAASSGAVSFNPGASPWSGFSSMSSLTLQPFDEPVVSVPPAYQLPELASNLLAPEAAPAATATAAAGTPTPLTATPMSAPSTPMSTDVPAWLLASSTGLLMLVAAGHFVRATTRNMASTHT